MCWGGATADFPFEQTLVIVQPQACSWISGIPDLRKTGHSTLGVSHKEDKKRYEEARWEISEDCAVR